MRRPEMLVPVTFLAAILLGTVLLSLPWMSNGEVGLLEAFFTSVSSVCVTGLIVVDTGADFTTAGQAVILGLIQLGGLGIMTLSLFALVIVGRRVSMNQETHVKERGAAPLMEHTPRSHKSPLGGRPLPPRPGHLTPHP